MNSLSDYNILSVLWRLPFLTSMREALPLFLLDYIVSFGSRGGKVYTDFCKRLPSGFSPRGSSQGPCRTGSWMS